MSPTGKKLKLAAALVAPRASSGGWRHDNAATTEGLELAYCARLAGQAEAGKLDFLFMPDQYRTPGATPDEFERHSNVWLEPVTLMSALAAVTTHVGLAATVSTTFQEPYHVARMFASLDHLSGGRASWNIVQSRGDAEESNFGGGCRPAQEERAEHSRQFVEIVKALWDSWEDGAIVADKVSGIYADPSKVHRLNHESKWFTVKGPLNVPRPPQGHPLLIEAGESDAFRERAARQADVIFTMLNDLSAAREFYRDTKRRLAAYGRGWDDLVIMPGLSLIVGATPEEARRKQEELARLERSTPRLDLVSFLTGLNMEKRGLRIDSELPDAADELPGSKYAAHKERADQLGLRTVEELYRELERGFGHLSIVGSAEQVADTLEEWLALEAADGFIYIPSVLPSGLNDLVELVVPELQRRGIFKTDYEGATLRERLGVSRPRNSFTGG
ncbi:NtaA/DmoA family FMN-dependent monooxygenase [Cohnella fermenti]|uniref:LLM class flavin-dependent oxidoreductase n=1 Tax=Cohnella fermenti TaxID=2565925 RepID=A0A4S4CA70_9BACL|nr:NtaA/DmoA family FMN-dependent monooxygenase [Cohnella fermenti]THF84667.1 LLM class flavin-dependent oxidoreductase [Cohnella fermenti]